MRFVPFVPSLHVSTEKNLYFSGTKLEKKSDQETRDKGSCSVPPPTNSCRALTIACGVAVRPGWLLVEKVVGWVEIHYTTSFQNHDLQGTKQSSNQRPLDTHQRVRIMEFIKKGRQKESEGGRSVSFHPLPQPFQ